MKEFGMCEGCIGEKQLAIYGGVEKFDNDYEKYISALCPEDNDLQNNFLKKSKSYYEILENNLMVNKDKSEIFNTIDFINIKVLELTKGINNIFL